MSYAYRCGSDDRRRGFFVLRDNLNGDGSVYITDHWTGSCWWNAKDRSFPPKLYPSIDDYTRALRECESKGAPDE